MSVSSSISSDGHLHLLRILRVITQHRPINIRQLFGYSSISLDLFLLRTE